MTGTWVGPGSAARNTSRTSRRESIKIGTFPARTIILCSLYCGDLDLFIYFRASNLLEGKFDCLGFSRAGNRPLLSPLFLMLSKH